MVIGLSGLTAMRIHRRAAGDASSAAEALFYARSAIERGFFMIRNDSTWRTTLGGGFWFVDQPLGRGTVSLQAAFVPDGDADPTNDPVLLTGTGDLGRARHMMQVRLVLLDGTMVVAPGSWKQIVN